MFGSSPFALLFYKAKNEYFSLKSRELKINSVNFSLFFYDAGLFFLCFSDYFRHESQGLHDLRITNFIECMGPFTKTEHNVPAFENSQMLGQI